MGFSPRWLDYCEERIKEEEQKMKENTLATPDSEKELESSKESLDLHEDAHIQLSKGRFLLVLIGLVLAIFLVSFNSPFPLKPK